MCTTRLLPKSATQYVPSPASAVWYGRRKRVSPARGLIDLTNAPSVVNRSIRLFSLSVTMTVAPSGDTETPRGKVSDPLWGPNPPNVSSKCPAASNFSIRWLNQSTAYISPFGA